ncbi:glutamate synthase (NADPH) small subunit [Breoghania corrubedonensis]|uniref:dihydrouracil dehydrogenase (NAD(+)) n=1 Tax=Breoghania corrubedonensis TaxID=665038 RepID=A0A2T5V7K5_9HYPH|nr:NAD(P)-dependent oxidoreductase [Breoghania corrubedonensis]PTW59745.1 glutamate synthase (NADPH) small subunit [Breoghania corrubedonensis]
MTDVASGPDIACGRLPAEAYLDNFTDLHPPLDAHEAVVEADRCYFCFDAPCTQACPTSIDIPLFIRQISTGNDTGSAKTIFASNILGGMCARVCPTETLCEEACVRMEAEGKPVKIGLLQRHATDHFLETRPKSFATRAPETGKTVAIVGGGPAGLSCAHRLAELGHAVTIYDAKEKLGGLNEYGIAAYKTVDGFAQAEVDFILSVGGITVEAGKALGRDFTLADLKVKHDAVFLAMGLAGVNALRLEGEEMEGVLDAVDYIARLRQADDLATLPVGRRVVVIGGGMTAIDIAVQMKRLGAEDVTIAYRRGAGEMKASPYEQELALTNGVVIRHWMRPAALIGAHGRVSSIVLEGTRPGDDGRLEGTGETLRLEVDQVFKAIGQTFLDAPLLGAVPKLEGGRIEVDEDGRTSVDGVWAGGDCVAGGEDLTVAAVADGKRAADAIHRSFGL